jgi:hypothetical protein
VSRRGRHNNQKEYAGADNMTTTTTQQSTYSAPAAQKVALHRDWRADYPAVEAGDLKIE